MLFYPFDQQLLSVLTLLTALPYFVARANDLHRAGYHRRDLIHVYGSNFMLLFVNSIGSIKSLGQAIGGQKVAFARTPKVQQRTAAPFTFIIIPILIIGWSIVTFVTDLPAHRYLHAIFSASNAAFTLYSMVVLYGIWNIFADTSLNLREWLFRPVRRETAHEDVPDWVTVLYYGTAVNGEARASAPVAGALAAMDLQQAGQQEILLATNHGHLGPVRADRERAITFVERRSRDGDRRQNPDAPLRTAGDSIVPLDTENEHWASGG